MKGAVKYEHILRHFFAIQTISQGNRHRGCRTGFKTNQVTTIFLSEIAKIEFASTVWKKVRTKEISDAQATTIIELFDKDCERFAFMQLDSIVTEQAKSLIVKYGKQGLRTMDSIQLSTAIILKQHASLFITSDTLLNIFFKLESLPSELNG